MKRFLWGEKEDTETAIESAHPEPTIEELHSEWEANPDYQTLGRLYYRLKRENSPQRLVVIDQALERIPKTDDGQMIWYLQKISQICIDEGRFEDGKSALQHLLSRSEKVDLEVREDCSFNPFFEERGVVFCLDEMGRTEDAVSFGMSVLEKYDQPYVDEGVLEKAILGFLLDLNRVEEARELWTGDWDYRWAKEAEMEVQYIPDNYWGADGRMGEIVRRAVEDFGFEGGQVAASSVIIGINS